MTSRSSIFHVLALPATLCSMTPSASGAATELRPYTAELMLKSESVGEVAFSPRGDRLLLEKLVAYDTSPNFGWSMLGEKRAILLEASLSGKENLKTIAAKKIDKVSFASYSPSGAKAAVKWLDGAIAKVGIYDVKTETLRKLDLPANVWLAGSEEVGPNWLSEEEFILFSQTADQQLEMARREAYRSERASQLARSSWKGVEPGVTAFGSGKHWIKGLRENGALLRVNVRTGKITELASGQFQQFAFSPDRRRLAVIRAVGDLDFADANVKAIKLADKKIELLVYDFTNNGAEVRPCNKCNVTADSLRWSPSGRNIFFSTRVNRGGNIEHDYYIYDFHRGYLERFSPRGLDFDTDESIKHWSYITPFVWLTDDTPAVRVTMKTPSAPSSGLKRQDRHDWYALPPGRAPVVLTAGLNPIRDENPLDDFVAVHRGKLLVMADGDLWQLSPDGTRKNLTQGIDEPLSPWCSALAAFRENFSRPVCSGLRTENRIRPVDQEALAKGWLTLRILRDDVFTGDLLFLNVDSGRSVRIARPGPHAELVTASALAQIAVYIRRNDDSDRLLLTSAGGVTRELLHINQHLAGVVGGKPVLLTRHEPGETEERYDWLLLPPGHKPGQRHPLMVYFYPETKFTKELPRNHLLDLRSVHFLNMHLPAARGYAVLFASTKISEMGTSSNPMTEMHEQLIRAAENAVQAGYADPERWALMGHSYGGYGTSSVITQTNRFKTAIAMAGVSNLTSSYANGLNKASVLSSRLSYGAAWAEGGQGRMGGAPWQDPQRYIANSPLIYAHKIEVPLMLIHGDDDDAVDVSESLQMFYALLRQDKDAVFLRYWGEGHLIQSPANIRDMWTRIFAWLDEHLDVRRDSQGNVMLEDQRNNVAQN